VIVMENALRKIAPAAESVEGYLNELKRYPLLSRAEELVLATRYQKTRDPEAARRLVTANLRLVVKLAHEYRRAQHDLLDLVQEGNIGLLQALDKFDPARGNRFPSYAAWWIRAYMLRFIVNDFSLVKIGTSPLQRKLFFNLRKEKRRLEAAGFVPSSERLAKALGAPEAEVIDMDRRLSANEVRLDAPAFRDEEDSRSRLDELAADGEEQPDNAVEATEFRARLRGKLADFGRTVSGRERTIFDERLMSESPKSLTEIGASYGISRERARQIEKALMGKLRRYLRRELGDAVTIALGQVAAANDNEEDVAARVIAA
jgi:RNA polymerase sigma-32 factor